MSNGAEQVNEAARQVLANYLKTNAPGHALLLDARWGAGKTEFLRRETKFENDDNIVYVSLFGIGSAQQLDWALTRAILPWSGNKFAKAAKEMVKGVRVWGVSFSLSQVSLIEFARSRLPDTLIFDDLERCTMPQTELSGVLNTFVEHGKKRVILVSNSERFEEKPTFAIQKEKLIGRTISICPEVESAFSIFVMDCPSGSVRARIKSDKTLILDVFEKVGQDNLRLLRQAMRDWGDVLSQLADELIQREVGLVRLARTYLALHMAYHSGRITRDDLDARGNFRALVRKGKDENPRLSELAKAVPEADIQCAHVCVLPCDLAVQLLVQGYASPVALDIGLRMSGFFAVAKDTPDWLRLWRFADEPRAQIEDVLRRIEADLAAFIVEDPGVILQIYGARCFLQEFGGLPGTKQDLKDETILYIETLEQRGKIPPRKPLSARNNESYGFSFNENTFSFKGHGFETDKADLEVINAMKMAMDRVYDSSIAEFASRALSAIRDDLPAFRLMFMNSKNGHTFSEAPIFDQMPVCGVSTILLERFESDRESAINIAEIMARRRNPQRVELAAEHPWFDALETQLIEDAAKVDPILGAQMSIFVARYFKAPRGI